jgi:hypothetical protein
VADRRTQILALLATRYDHLPEPIRRDPTSAGFVHRTLAPTVCPTCDGVDPHCPECRGHGEIETWRTRDPYATDRVSPYGIEATSKLGHVPTRDAELSRLAEQTAPPVTTEADLVAAANEHPYGWERARQAMYAEFDYAALDLALERLAGYVIAAHSERGLELLDRWLPNPLRAPVVVEVRVVVNAAAKGRQADPRARRQRDDAIGEMIRAGLAYGHIARTVGLTPRQLRRIVGQRDEAA